MRRLDKEQLNWLEETSRNYEMTLDENPAALSYLDGRGVSTDSANRFRLGLVEDPPPEHKSMLGRLAIPTLKRAGVVGFKFKCIREECITDRSVRPWREKHEGHGKYVTYEPQAMYNVAALDTDQGFLALCEGEFDALILDGECDIPAIALPGVNSWESHVYWRRLLKDFRRIWIFADVDASGVGKDFALNLQKRLPQAVIVDLPLIDGEDSSDVNIVYCRKGRQFLRDMIGLK